MVEATQLNWHTSERRGKCQAHAGPLLLPSRGKCLFSQAGMDLTSSTSLLTLTAFSDTAQGKLHSRLRWNQHYEGETFE